MTSDVSSDARYAGEFDSNVDAEKIGEVYAEALFASLDRDLPRCTEVMEEFHSLVKEVLRNYPQFENVLASRLISPEEKIGILDRVFSAQVSAGFLNFLKVLARHERLDCLPSIYRQAQKMYNDLQGKVRVVITTATPLSVEAAQQIGKNLRPKLQADPIIVRRVDPEVLGGMVIRVGDTIYDGSVSNQLKNMREKIINRSVHEI